MGNEEWSPVTPPPPFRCRPCPRRPGGPCQERAAISLARPLVLALVLTTLNPFLYLVALSLSKSSLGKPFAPLPA